MILLLAVAAWMLTMSLVAGLCAAARAGDTQLVHASAPAGRGRMTPAQREPAGRLDIAARANPRSAKPDAAVALQRRGVAA
ncbi:MAG: hypothetical protein ACLP1Q_21545 [Solirubrobacteraceae bacterium]